jgi:hypothetical protein
MRLKPLNGYIPQFRAVKSREAIVLVKGSDVLISIDLDLIHCEWRPLHTAIVDLFGYPFTAFLEVLESRWGMFVTQVPIILLFFT